MTDQDMPPPDPSTRVSAPTPAELADAHSVEQRHIEEAASKLAVHAELVAEGQMSPESYEAYKAQLMEWLGRQS